MENVNYKYSTELARPEGSIDCDRRNPLIALREMRNIRRNQKEVKNYMPPVGVRLEKFIYHSYDSTEIVCYLLKPEEEQEEKSPCMVYYHGGGFMMPLQEMMLQNAAYYARHSGCHVFLPEYRYVPAVSCRTVIEDCFALVNYLKEHSGKHKIDFHKLIIYGDSAGAALAAGVTHLMRDRGLPKAAGQMLIYPVTDCYSERYASMQTYRYAVWPPKSNAYMWRLYLKGVDDNTVKLAAPLNMDNFEGLPHAYVEPQEIDILRDEGIAYAEKLKKHGSLTELNVIEGSYHGFDFDHNSPLVQRILEHRCEVIQKFAGEKRHEKI